MSNAHHEVRIDINSPKTTNHKSKLLSRQNHPKLLKTNNEIRYIPKVRLQ